MIGTITEEIRRATDDLRKCSPHIEAPLERFALRLQEAWLGSPKVTNEELAMSDFNEMRRGKMLDIIRRVIANPQNVVEVANEIAKDWCPASLHNPNLKAPASIAELETILNSEDDRPIKINPDGSISPL